MSQDNRPLPPGWARRFDINTGWYYYIDNNTGTTTWDDPRPAYYEDSEDSHQSTTSSEEKSDSQKTSSSDRQSSEEEPEQRGSYSGSKASSKTSKGSSFEYRKEDHTKVSFSESNAEYTYVSDVFRDKPVNPNLYKPLQQYYQDLNYNPQPSEPSKPVEEVTEELVLSERKPWEEKVAIQEKLQEQYKEVDPLYVDIILQNTYFDENRACKMLDKIVQEEHERKTVEGNLKFSTITSDHQIMRVSEDLRLPVKSWEQKRLIQEEFRKKYHNIDPLFVDMALQTVNFVEHEAQKILDKLVQSENGNTLEHENIKITEDLQFPVKTWEMKRAIQVRFEEKYKRLEGLVVDIALQNANFDDSKATVILDDLLHEELAKKMEDDVELDQLSTGPLKTWEDKTALREKLIQYYSDMDAEAIDIALQNANFEVKKAIAILENVAREESDKEPGPLQSTTPEKEEVKIREQKQFETLNTWDERTELLEKMKEKYKDLDELIIVKVLQRTNYNEKKADAVLRTKLYSEIQKEIGQLESEADETEIWQKGLDAYTPVFIPKVDETSEAESEKPVSDVMIKQSYKGLLRGPQGLAKGPQGLAKGPRGLAKGPRGLAKGPQGLAKGPSR